MPIRTTQRLPQHAFVPPQPSHAVYRKIAYSFLGLTVLVVIGALWLSSVRARITVNVKHDTKSISTTVDVAKKPESGQIGGRVVQGTFSSVQEFAVKGEGTPVPATGTMRGTVKIINDYSKPQTLVEKTRLLTSDNRLYRIDKTITVPSKGTVTVAAHSDQEGASFVLLPGTKMTIPGLWIDLQKWITAEAVSGFSGGSGTSVKVASEQDLADAYKTIQDVLVEKAKKTLDAEAAVGDGWKAVYDVQVSEKKNNVTAGQTADQFLASVKLVVTAVYYPEKEIDALLRSKLKDQLPDGRDLTDFDASQATITIESPDVKNETAKLQITANAGSRLTDKSPQLAKENFVGLSETDAKNKAQAIDGVDSVEIRIMPSWIHTIPSNASHLEVVVQ